MWQQRFPMLQVSPDTAKKKKKSQGQREGLGLLCSAERGGGRDSWGRRCSPLDKPAQV